MAAKDLQIILPEEPKPWWDLFCGKVTETKTITITKQDIIFFLFYFEKIFFTFILIKY